MKYNFNEAVSRRGTNCVKWDLAPEADTIPLWVADMDFCAAPCIREALQRRLDHGIFGYATVPDAFYATAQAWFEKYHGWHIEREWMQYTTGVVPAISATLHALAKPGESVLVQTPVYNCFFSSIRNQGLNAEKAPLRYVCNGEQPTYEIDFDDFERRCAKPEVTIFLLCNPHNPAGRVWTREELQRMGEICLRHGVLILSDEIHCEITFEGHSYTPMASVSEEIAHQTVVFISPSKSFNIAGLQMANIICDNEERRRKIDRAINDFETCDLNVFAIEAQIAAYGEGRPWIEALNEYLWENYKMLCNFFKANFPQLPVCRLEGTYLPSVNISATGKDSDTLCKELLKENKVWLNPGTMYGPEGKDFVRINIACPRQQLAEALQRIKTYFDKEA